MLDVAVVGGGIAGLAAAYTLAKRGVSFVLLEASPRWGGVIRTESEDGFLYEPGPDSILAQKPEAVALCRELGLGDHLQPTNPKQRTVFVLHRRRLHALPEGMVLAIPTRIGPFARSSLFSWPGKLRMGLDLLIPPRRNGGDESIASFLRRRFGQESVDRLGEPLLAGIHAGDAERLSIRATFPRFAELETRHGSLIRGMWASARSAAVRPGGASSATPPAAFYTLAGGLREVIDALVARLPASSLKAKRTARSLAREGTGFALTCDGGERLTARTVIVALPGPKAAPLVEPFDGSAARTLAAIPFVSSATVMLGYRREDVRHPLDGYGIVIPKTESLRTSALSFVSTKFPGRAPEGHVLLRGFLGGARDPAVLALDDATLAGIVRTEMTPVLGLSGEPVLSRVYRWPEATPQMEVGHLERVAELERRLAGIPGLFLTGAGLRVTGIPDGVADATRAATTAADFLEH
jgi:oxygen-dependent protoporphyrinogen oxidase